MLDESIAQLETSNPKLFCSFIQEFISPTKIFKESVMDNNTDCLLNLPP